MTHLSVNVNKIALIRNSRGRDYPSVLEFSKRCLDLGAQGITLHPRPDQRHARYSDVASLKPLCERYHVELNVEGYPTEEFLRTVCENGVDQCTLVPDAPDQITSDHGWEVGRHIDLLQSTVNQLKSHGIRSSLFVDHGCTELELIRKIEADRVELYTEPYAEAQHNAAILKSFQNTAEEAQSIGLGVNAGHDLNLGNLKNFLTIPDILEVSIGHALIVECVELGIEKVISSYLEIIRSTQTLE